MTDNILTEERRIDKALSRSVLYSALAVSLSRPADDRLERVRGMAGSEVLRNAAGTMDRLDEESSRRSGGEADPGREETGSHVPGQGAPVEPVSPLVPAVVALIRAGERAVTDDLDEAYQRLFGHTARGKVTPYETEYGREALFRQSQDLADINGFYHAFGLTLSGSTHERTDHVAAECEFMSFLTSREARMAMADDRERRKQVLRAERLFLRDHLGNFGRGFARALTREADHPFYQAAGNLCFDVLTYDCRDLGVPPGAEFVELRSTSEVDVPMACGSACSLLRNGPPFGGKEDAP